MSNWSLATIQLENGTLSPSLVVGEWLYPLSSLTTALEGKSVFDLLNDWDSSFEALHNLALSLQQGDKSGFTQFKQPLSKARLDTPIRFPRKLLAVGANYASHLKEMGMPSEKWDPMPFFSCPPTTSIVGPGKTVKMPSTTKQFDWECEMTVVMGKYLNDATPAEAAEAIAGYTIGLDLSCRDLLASNSALVDLARGKAQTGMKPCGPFFWPKECLGANVGELHIQLWVNDELMMDGNTAEMLWKPEECLAEISKVIPLEPGDMVMTGTPAGSATSHGGRWLKKGDIIKAQIGPLGQLEVEIF